MTLNELADQVEKAEGPDRALDVTVDLAIGNDRDFPFGMARGPGYDFSQGQCVSQVTDQPTDAVASWFDVPKFTASLDAAMTLVPEGHQWAAGNSEDGPFAGIGNQEKATFAATPALALCAAALRARASS